MRSACARTANELFSLEASFPGFPRIQFRSKKGRETWETTILLQILMANLQLILLNSTADSTAEFAAIPNPHLPPFLQAIKTWGRGRPGNEARVVINSPT